MSAFAMVEDLGSKWEHSTGEQLADLNQALDEAAVMITAALINAGKTVAGTDPAILKLVSVQMVRHAFPPETATIMGLPVPMGAESTQVGVGQFQQSLKFGGGGSGRLWLGPDQRKLLGLHVQKAFALDMLPAGWEAPQ